MSFLVRPLPDRVRLWPGSFEPNRPQTPTAAAQAAFFFAKSNMAQRLDPQDLPVIRVDAHLPRVPPVHLVARAFRQRFLSPPVWSPEIGIERDFVSRPPVHAAVLVPLVLRDQVTVLLTRRAERLTDHPGQISFPGGRAEPGDADSRATALREAHEEIGLEPARVELLGALPTYTTGTGFVVTPVIGLVEPGFTLHADPFEVAEIFEVPLGFLMDPANHRWHSVDVDGAREFLSMPWVGRDADGLPKRYFVWGATAAMLRNLYRFLMA